MSKPLIEEVAVSPLGSVRGDEEDLADTALFQEPEGYYEPEKQPSFVDYTLPSVGKLRLRLVGHSPLWGHLLWNAGQVVSEYLQQHAQRLVRGKDVLELGAGAGLPSIVCAILGAKKVMVTDYPDEELVKNLEYNIEQCKAFYPFSSTITTEGYLWGASLSTNMLAKFDLLILADVVFNHTEHAKVLVFFTPYRPWLLEKDLEFFNLAKEGGFVVEKVLETVMEKAMFVDDRGDELLRRTVFGYELRWQE